MIPQKVWDQFSAGVTRGQVILGQEIESKMNRTELVELIADKAGIPKTGAEKVLSAVLDSIAVSLKKDEPVVLVNFGTFVVKQRAARKGRNPQTGEEIKIKT